MNIAQQESQPHCPICGHLLERVGSIETGLEDDHTHRIHAYVCPSGCRGTATDGTFEVEACPVCGSFDTSRGERFDGAVELSCRTCGAVVIEQGCPADGS